MENVTVPEEVIEAPQELVLRYPNGTTYMAIAKGARIRRSEYEELRAQAVNVERAEVRTADVKAPRRRGAREK